MTPPPDFGHAPMTAAASKALAAGGASRKGRPSPFHRALADPALSYHHWWILTALRVRTAATAGKLLSAEYQKLRDGHTTNGHGDLVSLTYGHLTQDRSMRGHPFTVTKLHGWRKHRRRFFPEKSTHYVTSHLYDALQAVLKIHDAFEKQEAQEKAAAKAGFVSIEAHWRWHQRHEKEKVQARAEGYNSGREDQRRAAQTATQATDPYPDLNTYGLAPDRDRIEGPVLVLVNKQHTREHRVSLVDYFNLPGTYFKNLWRHNGWHLPAYTPPKPPKPPKFRVVSHERHIQTAPSYA